MNLESFIVIYLILINLLAFGVMGWDKSKARRRVWRIPEKTLFFIALLGGSIGGIAGMQYFRHKTKHGKFVYGFPAIFVIQVIVVILALKCKY